MSALLPLFPLNILPLAQERVPLHIFEPRYRQLVEDLENDLTGFGIMYAGKNNKYLLGTHMTLVKVLKKYETGESDILCVGGPSFMVLSYKKEFPGKLYPGAVVHTLVHENIRISNRMDAEFREYMAVKQQPEIEGTIELDEIANELDLDIADRLAYLKLLQGEKRERFLHDRLRFTRHMLMQEQKFGKSYLYN